MKKIFLFLILLPFFVCSQSDKYIKITGLVVDKVNNKEIPYANISTETNLGTISNIDGRVVFKYPKELIGSRLSISSIGYKKYEISLPDIDTEDIIFSLISDTFSLDEVKVIPIEAIDIINMAIENIPINYSDSTVFMDIFYQNINKNLFSIEQRNKQFYFKDMPINKLKEAAVTIKKESKQLKQEDLYRVNAFRYQSENNSFIDSLMTFHHIMKSDDLDSLESIKSDSTFRALTNDHLQSSLSKEDLSWSLESYDVINNRRGHDVLSKKRINKFIFELRDIVNYNDRPTYRIDVFPKKCTKKCLDNGEIYIDLESYAFVYEHYISPSNCDKCFEERKMLVATVSRKKWENTISYKKYKSFWSVSNFSRKEEYSIKMGSIIFSPLYLISKLKGKLPKEKRGFFPKSIHININSVTEFFVTDIYMHDDIGFNVDNTMEETIVEEINADNKDIWGNFNYLEYNIEDEK